MDIFNSYVKLPDHNHEILIFSTYSQVPVTEVAVASSARCAAVLLGALQLTLRAVFFSVGHMVSMGMNWISRLFYTM